MPLNDTVLALVLTFIPGILCYGVASSLAVKRERNIITIFLQIFMYGVAAYLILALFCQDFPKAAAELHVNAGDIPLLNPSHIGKSVLDPLTITAASVVAVVLGLMIAVNVNLSLLMRLCRRMRLTNRFSDPDVWSFVLNSKDIDNWAIIRLPSRGLIYQGYVRAFSAGDKERELVLTQVQVFDYTTAEQLGDEVPIMYISLEKENLLMELNPRKQASAKRSCAFSASVARLQLKLEIQRF